MKIIEIPPIIETTVLSGSGLPIPSYVFRKGKIEIGVILVLYKFFLKTIRSLIRMRLKIIGPTYKKYRSAPDHAEVEKIYTRESSTYEEKHHKTTNFLDTQWRRMIGFDLISFSENTNNPIRLLDVATGVGLSIEEVFRIFELFNRKIDAIGIDYNESMIGQAKSTVLPRMQAAGLTEPQEREAVFVRADARNLTEKKSKDDLCYFPNDYFDCVTALYGIGGIDLPTEAFHEILSVLKPGGIFIMLDIHRPLFHLPEHWPWFVGKRHGTAFSFLGWEEVTKPLVLGTLWGWRDPTADFYTSRFVVKSNQLTGSYYGFEVLQYSLLNEFWWLRLPVVTTGKLVLKKVEISKQEFERRLRILDQLSYHGL